MVEMLRSELRSLESRVETEETARFEAEERVAYLESSTQVAYIEAHPSGGSGGSGGSEVVQEDLEGLSDLEDSASLDSFAISDHSDAATTEEFSSTRRHVHVHDVVSIKIEGSPQLGSQLDMKDYFIDTRHPLGAPLGAHFIDTRDPLGSAKRDDQTWTPPDQPTQLVMDKTPSRECQMPHLSLDASEEVQYDKACAWDVAWTPRDTKLSRPSSPSSAQRYRSGKQSHEQQPNTATYAIGEEFR